MCVCVVVRVVMTGRRVDIGCVVGGDVAVVVIMCVAVFVRAVYDITFVCVVVVD